MCFQIHPLSSQSLSEAKARDGHSDAQVGYGNGPRSIARTHNVFSFTGGTGSEMETVCDNRSGVLVIASVEKIDLTCQGWKE